MRYLIILEDNTNADNNYIIDYNLPIILKNNPKIKKVAKPMKIKANDKIIGKTCSLCEEKFVKGELKKVLSCCGCVYHKKCIDRYLYLNDDIIGKMICPKCKHEFTFE